MTLRSLSDLSQDQIVELLDPARLSTLPPKDREAIKAVQDRVRADLAAQAEYQRFNQLERYAPHKRQAEFHEAGEWADERLFMAGNQLGKTFAGAAETAIHLTGRYPDWWQGARFEHPTHIIVAGESGESTRDVVQKALLGPPEMRDEGLGLGAIPRECIVSTTAARSVANLLDTITVRHVNGVSTLMQKTYGKGQDRWMGISSLDAVWFDEEPPSDVYDEGRTRCNHGQRGPFSYMTFTPLKGMTAVVKRFLSDEEVESWKEAS